MKYMATYMESGHISGPVCPKGGHIRAKIVLSVNKVGEAYHLHGQLSAWIENACLTDTLRGYILCTVIDGKDNSLGNCDLELPSCPGRGLPWNAPTGRGASEDFSISLPPGATFGGIQWKIENRDGGDVTKGLDKAADTLKDVIAWYAGA